MARRALRDWCRDRQVSLISAHNFQMVPAARAQLDQFVADTWFCPSAQLHRRYQPLIAMTAGAISEPAPVPAGRLVASYHSVIVFPTNSLPERLQRLARLSASLLCDAQWLKVWYEHHDPSKRPGMKTALVKLAKLGIQLGIYEDLCFTAQEFEHRLALFQTILLAEDACHACAGGCGAHVIYPEALYNDLGRCDMAPNAGFVNGSAVLGGHALPFAPVPETVRGCRHPPRELIANQTLHHGDVLYASLHSPIHPHEQHPAYKYPLRVTLDPGTGAVLRAETAMGATLNVAPVRGPTERALICDELNEQKYVKALTGKLGPATAAPLLSLIDLLAQQSSPGGDHGSSSPHWGCTVTPRELAVWRVLARIGEVHEGDQLHNPRIIASRFEMRYVHALETMGCPSYLLDLWRDLEHAPSAFAPLREQAAGACRRMFDGADPNDIAASLLPIQLKT